MSRTRVSILAGLTGLAIAAPAAQAHVTLNPRTVTANSFGRVDMRVPNERDEAGTKSVVLYFPHGFYSVSTKRVWGWTAKTSMRKLATPVPSTDGDITEEVAKITYRATTKGDWIMPGQFEEFGLSMRIPNTPNATLSFPARQTYSNGEVVNWNTPASGENPAPTLNVVAPAPVAAAAHTPLKSVTPKRNSTQHKAVADVRATFKAKMQTGLISITNAGGATVPLKSSGLMSSNKAVVRGVPTSPLKSGTYKVSWRARASDGHSEKGTWTFKVSV
jgi:uncharacterized protein YcnI